MRWDLSRKKRWSDSLELELERKEMENKRTREKREAYERYENDFHNVSDSQGNRVFTCLNIKCRDLKFHSCEELRRHSNVHMNSACSRCSKLCFYEKSLFEHMNGPHLKIRRPYVCSECPGDGSPGLIDYASRKQLKSHLRKFGIPKVPCLVPPSGLVHSGSS